MNAFQPSIKEQDYFAWQLKYVTNRRGFSFDSFAFVVCRNYIIIVRDNATVLFLVLFELAYLTCYVMCISSFLVNKFYSLKKFAF